MIWSHRHTQNRPKWIWRVHFSDCTRNWNVCLYVQIGFVCGCRSKCLLDVGIQCVSLIFKWFLFCVCKYGCVNVDASVRAARLRIFNACLSEQNVPCLCFTCICVFCKRSCQCVRFESFFLYAVCVCVYVCFCVCVCLCWCSFWFYVNLNLSQLMVFENFSLNASREFVLILFAENTDFFCVKVSVWRYPGFGHSRW